MSNPHITALEELRDWLRETRDWIAEKTVMLERADPDAETRHEVELGIAIYERRADALSAALSILAEREKMVAEIDRLRGGGIASHLQTIAALEAVVRDREGFGGCESCGVPFQSDDDGVSMGDVYFCAKCYAEWKAEYDACEHEWGGGEYEGGQRICNKCNGYEPESPELAAAPQPPKGKGDE